MPWGKMDDKFHRNRKVRQLRKLGAKGREALGVWTFWWSWCLDDGGDFDGFVPADELDAAEVRCAALLVQVGLWDQAEDGFRFHDFNEYNPTRVQLEHKRESDRDRQRRRRESHGVSRRDTEASRGGVAAESLPARAAPTRPSPTQPDHNNTARSASPEVTDTPAPLSLLPRVVADEDPDADTLPALGMRVAAAMRDQSGGRWFGSYSNDPESFRAVAGQLRAAGVEPDALAAAFWAEVKTPKPSPKTLAKMSGALIGALANPGAVPSEEPTNTYAHLPRFQ